MLESLGPDLWVADGGIVSFFGFDYPTRMAVIRLDDGGLWLWSPVELTSELADQVSAGHGAAHRQSQQAPLFIPERLADCISGGTLVGDRLHDR